MKTLLSIAVFTVINLASAQKTTAVNDFVNLTVGSDMNVTLVKSGENKVVITEGEEEIDILDEGGSLVLNGEANVTVYYKNNLKSIVAASDSKIYGKDEIGSESLDITVTSDASVALTVKVKKLSTTADSDAQVTLTGSATNHVAVLASDAQLHSESLVTENTDIILSSDALAVITAKQNVKATVSGSLKIYGNPKNIDQIKGNDAHIVVVK